MNICLTQSRHFSLQELADGVYAAIATDGAAAICNAGLIDLGSEVVIYDTFLTPIAANDLLQSARSLFGRKKLIVVNSHFHNDHTWGNQVFANKSWMVSSSHTRELMAENCPQEVEWFKANLDRRVAEYQNKLSSANEDQRDSILLMLGEYQGLQDALPHFRLCLPAITFDQKMEFHGAKRIAELINFENGHTRCDTVLYLPGDGILFLSDLLFVGCHPYLGDGNPQGLQSALRKLIRMQAEYYIPGHGPVGTKDDVQKMVEYIDDCVDIASSLVRGGGNYEEGIASLEIPQAYQRWKISWFFPENIRFLCNQMTVQKEK